MKRKGWLSLLLSTVLLVAMLPGQVSATENEADRICPVQELTDALPEEDDSLTEETAGESEAQLLAIDEEKAELTENVTLNGDGTSSSPYQIGTADELATFRNLVNGGQTGIWGTLTADIDLNPGITFNADGSYTGGSPAQWTPIGNTSCRYNGTFDGGGHTVSGLYIDNTDNDQGLFGNTNGKIQNVGIVNAYVHGEGSIGSVAGYNHEGTIINCYNIGKVSGAGHVGGLCGYNLKGTITNSYNIGTVSGKEYVGGVCGEGSVQNCYYLDSCGAGGTGASKSKTQFEDGTVLGLLRNNSSGAAAWEGNKAVPGSTLVSQPVLAGQKRKMAGDGTQDAPYQIFIVADLVTFRNIVNNKLTGEETELGYIANNAAHAVLMADLDLNPEISFDVDGNYSGGTPSQWTPIGNESLQYTGTFDGGGHIIRGLYINVNSADQGLFGYIGKSGKVQNISVVNSYVGGNGRAGGVCAYNYGTIQNCCNSGGVKGNSEVGGVAGNSSGTIQNCCNKGKVNGRTNVAGIMGYSDGGSVLNCSNSAAVYGNNYVGGIAGHIRINGKIENSYNTGNVSAGQTNVGGVAGYNAGCSIKNCYNTGTVSGTEYVGGVIGRNNSGSGLVQNCYYLNTCGAKGVGSALTMRQMTDKNALTTMKLDSSIWAKAANKTGVKYYLPKPMALEDDDPYIPGSAPAYTVTIPANAEIGGAAVTIASQGVVLNYDQQVRVTLVCDDFTIRLPDVPDAPGISFLVKDEESRTLASGNPVLLASGDASAKLTFAADPDASKPKYSGTYKGTVNFTVSLETAEP